MPAAPAYFLTLVWFAVVVALLLDGKVAHFFRRMPLNSVILSEEYTHLFDQNDTSELFPLREQHSNKPLIIVAEFISNTGCEPNCEWQSNKWAWTFTHELNKSMSPCHCGAGSLLRSNETCDVQSVEGYYTSTDNAEKNAFMSLDGNVSVLVVNFCRQHTQDAQNKAVEAKIKEAEQVVKKYQVKKDFPFALHTLQETHLLKESKNQIRYSLASYEHLFTLPIALLLLVYFAGPLVVSILFTIPTTFLVTFSILDAVQEASHMTFASFLPPIFVALMVAVSLNYTLFMLARFHEEFERHPFDDAVIKAVFGTGRSIVTSTMLLVTAFSSLLICDINTRYEVVRALGIGGLVTIATVGLVTMTLLPSLVIVFGLHCRCCIAPFMKFHICTRLADTVAGSSYLTYGIRRPEKLLGAALLLTAPMIMFFAFGRTSIDQMQILCLGSPSLVPYNILKKSHFRLGILSGTDAALRADPQSTDPFNGYDLDALLQTTVDIYRPVIKNVANITCKNFGRYCKDGLHLPHSHDKRIGQHLLWRSCLNTCRNATYANFTRNGVLTPEFFNHTRRAVAIFTERRKDHEDWRDIQSIAHGRYNTNDVVNLEDAKNFILNSTNNTEEANLYRRRYVTYTSPDGNAGLVGMKLPFDPFGGDTEHWLHRVQPQVSMEVRCPIGGLIDKVSSIMSDFWHLVGIALVFLSLATVVIFRSLLLPLRLIFTMAFTFWWTFGCCFLIFQILASFPGLYWILLPGAAPVVMGLTLDYDLFLIARVIDLRKQGYSTKASLLRAEEATQKTICMAGSLMAIAFSSLLFSDIWLLREFGVVLVCGTLLDAFFVRPLLVPALMLVCDEQCNWWPRRMPPVSQTDYIDTISLNYPADSDNESEPELDPGGVNLWHGTVDDDNIDLEANRGASSGADSCGAKAPVCHEDAKTGTSAVPQGLIACEKGSSLGTVHQSTAVSSTWSAEGTLSSAEGRKATQNGLDVQSSTEATASVPSASSPERSHRGENVAPSEATEGHQRAPPEESKNQSQETCGLDSTAMLSSMLHSDEVIDGGMPKGKTRRKNKKHKTTT